MNSLAKELYRLTELKLQTQVELAKTRDQKCIAFVALASAATAIGANVVALADKPPSLFVGATAFFAASSIILTFCALPQKFQGLGYRFKTLNVPEVVGMDVANLAIELAAKNDSYINDNDRQSKLVTSVMWFGMMLFAIGMFLTLLAVVS